MAVLDAKVTNPREGGATFSVKHRATRAIWGIVWAGFGKWTPAPFHGWRRFLLSLFGARIAPTAKVYPGVRVWYPANLEMKAYACLGPRVDCYCMDKIVLDEYALVSQGAFLCGGTHDVDDPFFQLKTLPIRIGRNAWIAADAFVGPGVVVGEGTVLGARATAAKALEPWTIYVGNPAKPLRARPRFDS